MVKKKWKNEILLKYFCMQYTLHFVLSNKWWKKNQNSTNPLSSSFHTNTAQVMCRSQNCSAEQDQDFFTLHNFFFLPQPNKNLLDVQEKGKSCKDVIFFTSYPIFVTLHHHRTHLGQWQIKYSSSFIDQSDPV